MKYSVIVPIYKVEKYLRKCIETILSQSFVDFELILVDDGSPDNCPQICDEYAKKDQRIRVIHKSNGGLVNARNTGLNAAKGEYICYVDGDDWVEKNLLETITDNAVNPYSPDVIVFGAKRCFENQEIVIPSGLKEGIYSHKELKSKLFPYMMYDHRKPFCSGLIFPVAWNKIYKRNFLLKHYCRDERIRMGEDNAFIFECLYFAKSVFFCDAILYDYNQLNSESMIHSYDPNRFINNKYLTDYIESNLGSKNMIVDEQINAFKAYWLIMAIFHEVKSKIYIRDAVRHIKTGIRKTGCIKEIKIKKLPKSATLFLLLTKFHMYYLVVLGAYIVNYKRESK